jgi:hypothetical protein
MDTLGSRMAYDKAKEAINNAGFSAGQAVLSQGYIRTEVALSTTKTSYQFPILVNDNINGSSFNTSNLLNLQDAFYVSSIGLFFAKPSSSTDTTFQLVSYPNASIFSTSAATSAALFTWYNSSLQLVVNNRQIIPSYDLYRHYSVPQTQTATAVGYSASTNNTKDQQSGADSGFYPVEPGWVLVGSKNNTLTVNLPQAMSAIETNSRAIIIFRGHLAQNVTPVR